MHDRSRRPIPQPSNLEMQVLAVLWKQGPATARQVLDAMPDQKERAYTTILSVMQVMEKKGLLVHETAGNRHIYSPTVKKREVLGPLLRSLVANVFGSRPSLVVQQLLETDQVSDTELAEMRQVINDYAKGRSTKEKAPSASAVTPPTPELSSPRGTKHSKPSIPQE